MVSGRRVRHVLERVAIALGVLAFVLLFAIGLAGGLHP